MSNKPALRLFTEAPIDSLWEQLSLYESRSLAKRLIETKAEEHALSPSPHIVAAKATGIIFMPPQCARNNIRVNAKSLTIEATTNYYGCLWLCAAIAVANPTNDADLPRLKRRNPQKVDTDCITLQMMQVSFQIRSRLPS